MFNKKLIKLAKILLSSVLIISIFIMGYFLGDGIRKNKNELENKKSKNNIVSVIPKSEEITEEKVKDFLVAYYTKKELGENRERYKPFLTEGMYNSVVSNEDKASNKAYKGYIVDYEYENSKIYINKESKEVILNVKYKNTTLAKKDDRSRLTTQTNDEAFKLTYVETGGKLLVNKMERIVIDPLVEKG